MHDCGNEADSVLVHLVVAEACKEVADEKGVENSLLELYVSLVGVSGSEWNKH